MERTVEISLSHGFKDLKSRLVGCIKIVLCMMSQ